MTIHDKHAGRKLAMAPTKEPCWRCSTPLWWLEPSIDGWCYYCERCQHLTSTCKELALAMANKGKGAVGIVAGIPCRIDIAPAEGGGQ